MISSKKLRDTFLQKSIHWRTNKMSEDESSSIPFFIGDIEFQNIDGYLADMEGNPITVGNKAVAIQVKDNPTVNAIHRIVVNGKKMYPIPKQPKEERFAKVVEAMTDLHRKDGRYAKETGNKPFEKSRTNPDSFARAGEDPKFLGFGMQKNYEKFLQVGALAKLYDPKLRKATPSKPEIRTIRGKKAVAKQTKFEIDPLVQKWQKKRTTHRGSANADKLHQALAYLDLSPDQIVHPTDDEGNEIPSDDRKDWITARFGEETFEDEKGKKWFFGKRDFTTDPPTKTGIVYDLDPPRFNKDRTITFNKRNAKYKAGSEGVRMPMIALLKGFLEANGISIGKNPKESMWSLKVPDAKYSKIAMKAQQIKAMMDCLEKGIERVRNLPKSEQVLEETSLNTGKTRKITTHVSDWEDAYMYFILGLQLGYRSAEAFTLQARELDTEDDPNSGIFEDEEQMIVRIYTRKTAKVGMRFYGGNILYADTGLIARRLIDHRMDQVKKGIGIEKTWINPLTKKSEPYIQHSLIGHDGKYAEIGTLEYPAQAKLSRDEVKKLEEEGKPIEKLKLKPIASDRLKAIMRHCYEEVGLTKSYWITNSLHAVRHTFAQLWIKKSGYNYEFVRGWGHWTHLTTLMSHYGGQSDADRLRNANRFNKNVLDNLIADEEEEERKSEAEKEKARKAFELDYGTTFDKKDDNKEMKEAGKDDPDVETDDLAKEDANLVESDPDAEVEEVAVEEVKE